MDDGCLLQHTPGIGDHQRGLGLEREEVAVAERVDEADVSAGCRDAVGPHAVTRARVHREHDRRGDAVDRPQDRSEALGIVDVLLAVEGREHEVAGREAERGEPGRPVGRIRQGGERRVDHRVPRHHDAPVRDALRGEVGAGGLGGRGQRVGEVVDEDPVVLLGERAVEGPEPGLDVNQGARRRRRRRGRRRPSSWCRRGRRPPPARGR